MNQPLLSICIPTYNRARFLQECLASITEQFSDTEIRNNINVFILDNQSQDNTAEVAQEFVNIFDNIKYVKDDQKRNIAQGIIKVSSLATGEYVWVFSDDDLLKRDCLNEIIKYIKQYSADFILCNVDSFIDNRKIRKKNLLDIKENSFLDTRRSLLKFLNHKFYDSIDYYTTFCSNWLLKREFIKKTENLYITYNNPKLDLFPLPSLLFYSDINFTTIIVSKSLVLFRTDNTSWGYKNPFKHLIYTTQLLQHHYGNIIKSNFNILPAGFRLKVTVKHIRLIVVGLIKIIIILMLKKLKLYNMFKALKNR